MNRNEELRIIGQNIRYFRKAIGLTEDNLGKLTGIGRTGVSKIESGKINVTIGTLVVICQHLNIKMRNLMD